MSSDCTAYVGPGQTRPPGNTGYITDCGGDCDPGFTDIGRCNGPYISCQDKCGRDLPSCSFFTSRGVCERNYDTFTPVANGTLLTSCCAYSLGDTRLTINDCPPGVYGGSTTCTGLLDDVCLVDINSVVGIGCDALANDPNQVIKNRYNSLMKTRCTTTGIDNLNTAPCIKWCLANPADCGNDVLSSYCADKIGEEKYFAVCACFYPESFYKAIRDKLAQEYSVPETLLVGGRQCYYPLCSTASIKYNSTSVCRDLTLVKCINEIQINNDGTIGNITVNQDATCSALIKQPSNQCDPNTCNGFACDISTNKCFTVCTTSSQCLSGYTCNQDGSCIATPAKCSPNLCGGYKCNNEGTACLVGCTSNANCNLGYECRDARCQTTETFWQKYRVYIIVILILIVLILIIVGIFFGIRNYRRRKEESLVNPNVPDPDEV